MIREPEHFWETSWFCIFMLFACTPVGIFLMFVYGHFGTFLKLILMFIGIIFMLFSFVICSVSDDDPPEPVRVEAPVESKAPVVASRPVVSDSRPIDKEELERRAEADRLKKEAEAKKAEEKRIAREAEEKRIAEEAEALRNRQAALNTAQSRDRMRDELETKGGLTEKEAESAIEKRSPDWLKNALDTALIYAESLAMSRDAIFEQLTSEYGERFTTEEAEWALENLDWDYGENCYLKAEFYAGEGYSAKKVYEMLTGDYGEMFTEDEAEAALKRLAWDWTENAYNAALDIIEKNPDISEEALAMRLTSDGAEMFEEEDAEKALDRIFH